MSRSLAESHQCLRMHEVEDVMEMLASHGFPLGARQVRQLAAQYSETNDLNLLNKKQAGYYWVRAVRGVHAASSMPTSLVVKAEQAIRPVISKVHV